MSSLINSRRIFLLASVIALCAIPAAAQFIITTPDLPDGITGQPYSASLQSSGGIPPITYSIAVGAGSLPPGISLNSAGVFSGTPTADGFYSFTVQAVDSAAATIPQVTSKAFSIYVYAVITVSPATLPAAFVNLPFSVQLSASGGSAPYFFEFNYESNEPPPPWLSLSSSGMLSGTPPSTGSFSFGVWVWDSSESSAQKSYTLNVGVGVSFTTSALPVGVVGQFYSLSLGASGGSPPYTFSVVQGAPPAGITLNSSGLLSGTPAAAGSTNFTARVTGAAGGSEDRVFTLAVQPPPVNFGPTVLPSGMVNTPYSASFVVTGAGSGYTFSVLSGTLPPGLSLNSLGTVFGTPTSNGTFSFTARLTYGNFIVDKLVQIAVEVQPLVLQTATLPEGVAGQAYSVAVSAAGGVQPYSWSVTAGSLPLGVTLNSNGSLQGIPTRTGTFPFTAQVMDSRQTVATRGLSLVIGSNLAIITASLPEAVRGVSYQATILASGGIPPYTFTVHQGALPPGMTLESAGALFGTPTSSGTFQFTASVADASGFQTSAALSLIVVEPLELAPERLPAGNLTSAYDLQMQPSGGTPPYTLTLSGALPPGVAFQNGTFSGRPTEPGVYPVEITLVDARGRRVVHSNQLIIRSNIAIVTTSPLPQGTVGDSYSTAFAATSGVGPYTWESTGALPDGLSLSPSTGVLSGKLAKAGTFSFEIRVFDVTEASAVRPFTATIVLPPLPPVVFTQIGSTSPPAQQPVFGLRINQAYPTPLDGIVTLTFAPDRFGDDPAVMFSNGGRSMPFTIPAGQLDATFGSATSALQTGTSAGTITLTSRLSVDGTDVTPSPAPQQTILVSPSVPVITRLELNRVTGGFELIVTGYSTPRQLTQAVVKITPTSGSALATSEFPIPLESVFTSYYGSSASAPYGSQFRVVIPFFVPQGLSGLASASVTLTNSVGSSTAASVNF